MEAGDLLFYNGVDDLWTEPKSGKPREGVSRHWVGTVIEPAEDLTDAAVQLRPGFELGGVETMTVAEILDEMAMRARSDDPLAADDPEDERRYADFQPVIEAVERGDRLAAGKLMDEYDRKQTGLHFR